MLRTIICCLGMLLSTVCVAQTVDIKPRWLSKQPSAGNSSYEFKVFKVEASSIQKAKLSLPNQAAYYMERTYGVEGSHLRIVDENIAYRNGKVANDTFIKEIDSTKTVSDKVEIKLKLVDEYKSGNDCYFLCTVPNPNSRFVEYDQFQLTTKYGVRGLWRSAIVPGWGQFHKGANLKGGLILGGSAALAVGIVYTETMRKDYYNKIVKTHNVMEKRIYKTRSDNFAMGRNVCIGALGALYVYNLIDAIVAPGARYVKIQKVNRDGVTYAVAPTMTTTGDPAMAMSITF